MLWMFIALIMAGSPQRPMSEMHGDCEDYALDLSAEFKQWETSPRVLAAQANPKGKAGLALEETTRLSLRPMKQVSFPSAPPVGRQGFTGEHGGLVLVKVGEKGSYRFCLATKVWIDVVDPAGTPLKVQRFEMQTQCKKIFKVVIYELEANTDYWLQIAFCPAQELRLLLSTGR